ncbi:hypothetical protein QR685DRAFT_594088 [Neurospora intermedia]|uniref:Amidase domain-containing protein n=1 Tax=Neurospora intermedia TaxID=5142 RepID=A0ABR3DUH3_NEUIN
MSRVDADLTPFTGYFTSIADATAFASSWYHDAFCLQKSLLGSTGNCVRFPSSLDVHLEDLAAGLKKGLFTTIDPVNAYTRRILELNPDALSIASELDAAQTNGTIMGPDDLALRGARIGIPRNLIELDDPAFNAYAPVLPVFEAAVSVLRSAGAAIIDDLFLLGYGIIKQKQFVFENVVLNTDFPRIATFVSQLTVDPHNLTSLKDLERWPGRDTLAWDRAFNMIATITPAQAWGNCTSI